MSYEDSTDSEGSFPRSAARFAVIAPILAVLFNGALHFAGKSSGETPNQLMTVLGGVGTLILISVGFVCALIALCGIGRFGREGLLSRGVAGLLLNGILLAVFSLGFVKGFAEGFERRVKAREAQRDVKAAVNDLRGDLRKNFDPQNGITNVDLGKAQAIRTKLDEAATHLKGDDAAIVKTASVFLQQVEVAGRNLQGAFLVLDSGKVLEFESAPTAQDFQRRRRLVTNYQVASDRIRGIITNAPAFYRAELQRQGVAPANIDKAVRAMQTQSAAQNELVLEVRDTDTRMTTAMLAVFDLLERNTGKWEANHGQVLFSEAETASAYNSLIDEIKTAGRDQVEAQRKLVSMK